MQVDWTDPSNLTEVKMFFRMLARRMQELEQRVGKRISYFSSKVCVYYLLAHVLVLTWCCCYC